MDIPLNVDVHCQDGRCGRSTHFIVDPIAEKVTHVVVKESWPSGTSRLVPVSSITVSTPAVIVLEHLREAFSQLNAFDQSDFVFANVPHYASDPKLTLIWPHVVPAKRVIDAKYKRIPPGYWRCSEGRVCEQQTGVLGEWTNS